MQLALDGDGVYILPDEKLANMFWVLIDDRINNGINSHIIQIDISGKKHSNWGAGTLVHPTGLAVLPNNKILISE